MSKQEKDKTSNPDLSKSVKQSKLSKILGIVSGSFAPIIGLLAGAGLLKALVSILAMTGLLSADSGTYIVLAAAGSAVFYFLPVFLGTSVAIKLGANGYVGGAIGAALLTPDIIHLVEGGTETIDFLGLPVLLPAHSHRSELRRPFTTE